MSYFVDALAGAGVLITSFDPDTYQIVSTSLFISLIATLIAASLAIPAGIMTALNHFRGKAMLQHLLNTLMSMPTMVIGLLLSGLLSRYGPLGHWNLLYTRTAVIIAETILIFPIIMNLTIAAEHAADRRLVPTLRSLGARGWQIAWQTAIEMHFAIIAAIITGFGVQSVKLVQP